MLIGLDVGGTHTDVVLIGPDGPFREVKVITDTSNLFKSVLSALEKITEGIDTLQIKRAVLSTTLTTNAIVTDQIEPVGMIVVGGPGIDPEAYRICPYFYCVAGAIDHRGREIDGLDEVEVMDAAARMKADGIRHIGVVAKFSTRNPSHEIRIEKILAEYGFEKIFMGHRTSGNLNFPRRISTTFLNAAVYSVHKNFFNAVKQSLAEKGLNIPIHILKADGGTMSFSSSIDFPGQTILSGPAASVMGAISSAPAEGDVIVLDIGGTTTDIAVLINQSPVLEPLGISIGKYKTLIRSLKTYSLGVGGDSVVQIKDGELVIGPYRKGPAMAYGGSSPTPTDALFVLEHIDDGDAEAARKGIQLIADQLGLRVEYAAERIFEKTCNMILEGAAHLVRDINSKPVYTVHELLEGYTVVPARILVLGGPAKYFVSHLKKISGYSVETVPRWGVANAIGAGLARTTCEVNLFVDTEKGVVLAPEENYTKAIRGAYSYADAEETAFELVRKKAAKNGAESENLQIEIIESLSFNMVRGFRTTGKNIRIRAQVKPGLIEGYKAL
ncbi:MAG: hydantoinase/oxoprolinase family protein [Proteobacteria bacterium]|nr:hydantoinase/oxoprolinase family protein [Pseudomonadota bacterium]